MEDAGYRVLSFLFAPGENSKTLDTFGKILSFLAQNNVTRTDCLVALGGGITGDITGFVASAYLRGIKFIQIPTTFLAAIDSSVGGKTGVNLPEGKNLAGAFYQPELVICDCDTLKTLPEEIFLDGVAEALKYGVIADRALFEHLRTGNFLCDLEEIIETCVKIKAEFVSRDEFDTGLRALLNFGHTVAHAIEKKSSYQISHGHAVAIGMAVISSAAEKSSLSEENCGNLIKTALKSCHLPFSSPYSAKELLSGMLSDKKRSGESLTLILPKKIGEAFLYPLSVSELEGFISLGLQAIKESSQ